MTKSIASPGNPANVKARVQSTSFTDALALIAAHAAPLGIERIALDNADGRILAKAAVAQCTSPSSIVSAMDGYAVWDNDLARLPVSLPVAGRSFAGAGFNGALPPGTCVRVFTGAPAPVGTDRVVMQEDVGEDRGAAVFTLRPSARRHLRSPGSDFAKGDILVPAGSNLTPQRLVAVAAGDLAELDVFRQPRVAILCCGDELAEPGQSARSKDKIPESISYGVAALVRRWGGVVTARWRQPDDLDALRPIAAEGCNLADVMVVIGGASVGEKDLAKQAFSPKLDLLFSKVAMKPGKPVWFGRVGKARIIGLPGNPTSAMVTARLFLAPLLAGLSGGKPGDALDWRLMRSSVTVEGSHDRDVFVRATITARSALSLADQDSASQKALSDATHLIWRPCGEPSTGTDALVKTLVF